MDVTAALSLLLVGIIGPLIYYLKKQPPSANFLKGPAGIPFFGNTLQLIRSPFLTFSNWAYEFGDVYSIRLGRSSAVVVSNPKAMREIFGSSSSVGLFCPEMQEVIADGKYGVLSTEGEEWAENRRFLLQTMKNFGFVKNKMGNLLVIEAKSTVKWIKENSSSSGMIRSVDLHNYLKLTTNSSLWSMSSGKRLTDQDSGLSSLHGEMTRGLQLSVKRGTFIIPWLKYIFPNWTGYNIMKNASQEMIKFIRNEFSVHEQSFKYGSARDFIDFYIQQIKSTTDTNSVFYGEKGYRNAVGTIADIFYAGAETSSLTIMWALIYLAVYPEIQVKLQREIEDTIGNEEPSLEHAKSMPYLEAIILETLRLSSIIPFGVLQKLLDDIAYCEYTLKKGTILIPNLYHIHHNKNIWGDPQIFRPERFIEEGGHQLRSQVMPFQAGRRSCPGEPIARDSIFIFLARIFQEFKISCDPNVPRDDYLESNDGYILLPKCHNLIFEAKSS